MKENKILFKIKVFYRIFRILHPLIKVMVLDTYKTISEKESAYQGIKYPIYCMTCGAVLKDVWFEYPELEIILNSTESKIACRECSITGKDTVDNCSIIPKESIVWM